MIISMNPATGSLEDRAVVTRNDAVSVMLNNSPNLTRAPLHVDAMEKDRNPDQLRNVNWSLLLCFVSISSKM